MEIHISDFSSILELSVTMNLAYVIVDYTNSFTKIIADKLCNFNERIDRFKQSLISDVVMLKIGSLKPHEVDGNSTLTQIEDLKRKENIIKTQIENAQKELLENVEELSSSKCFSFICFYLAIFGILALFVSTSIQDIPFVEQFWLINLSISIGLLLLIWLFGDNDYIVSYSSSLRYCSYTLLGVVVISLLLAKLLCDYVEICNSLHVTLCIATPTLPLLNFLVYTAKTVNKSKRLSRLIQEKTDKLNIDISEIKKQVNQHEGLNAISGKFAVASSSADKHDILVKDNQNKSQTQKESDSSISNPKEHIFELLKKETLKISQIIKRTSLKHDQVRQCLRQLIKEKRVLKEEMDDGTVLYKSV